jgi:hypothetical protein
MELLGAPRALHIAQRICKIMPLSPVARVRGDSRGKPLLLEDSLRIARRLMTLVIVGIVAARGLLLLTDAEAPKSENVFRVALCAIDQKIVKIDCDIILYIYARPIARNVSRSRWPCLKFKFKFEILDNTCALLPARCLYHICVILYIDLCIDLHNRSHFQPLRFAYSGTESVRTKATNAELSAG